MRVGVGSVPSLFLARKPQQRLRMIFQREYFPSHHSSLRPHGCMPGGQWEGGFGKHPQPWQCVVMWGSAERQRAGAHRAGPAATVHTLSWCHMLLPEASGEVQDPRDTSGQMLVTQPGPVMGFLLLQPITIAVHRPQCRNPPSATAQAEAKAESVLLSHFGG